MEQQNEDKKYYVPDIEDIHYGYDMEWLNKANDSSFVLDGVEKDTWTKWDYEFQGYSIKGIKNLIADKRLRVPYLDKEQIEELGWNTESYQPNDYGILEYRGRIDKKYPGITWAEPMGVFWNICAAPKQKNNEIPKISITETEWGGFAGSRTTRDTYTGECKDKNTLKYIMKLLKIQ